MGCLPGGEVDPGLVALRIKQKNHSLILDHGFVRSRTNSGNNTLQAGYVRFYQRIDRSYGVPGSLTSSFRAWPDVPLSCRSELPG